MIESFMSVAVPDSGSPASAHSQQQHQNPEHTQQRRNTENENPKLVVNDGAYSERFGVPSRAFLIFLLVGNLLRVLFRACGLLCDLRVAHVFALITFHSLFETQAEILSACRAFFILPYFFRSHSLSRRISC